MPFCHIWYKNSDSPVVSPVTKFQPFSGFGNFLAPHLLGCKPPETVSHLVPVSVSLVEAECPRSKPSNNLRIYFNKHKSGQKQGLAVCSKSVSHVEDVSMRFIEWIELLRAQGVDKIILTILAVHPNVEKVQMCKFKSFQDTMNNFRYLNIIRTLVYLRWNKPL